MLTLNAASRRNTLHQLPGSDKKLICHLFNQEPNFLVFGTIKVFLSICSMYISFTTASVFCNIWFPLDVSQLHWDRNNASRVHNTRRSGCEEGPVFFLRPHPATQITLIRRDVSAAPFEIIKGAQKRKHLRIGESSSPPRRP